MLAEIFGLDAVVVVVVVIAVLFGGSQIPKLARSLGSAQREFRHGQRAGAEDASNDVAPPSPIVQQQPDGDTARVQ